MRPAKPFLIIVTGRPAAGKSTLARWLSKELNLPLVSKDSIREVLFDQLGWQDRTWARQLGRASIDLMFYFAQTQLESGHSFIMDNAFHPALSEPRFLALKAQTGAAFIQIVCDAKSEVLWQRFKRRAEAGNRHPGHGDADVYDELWQNLSQNLSPVMDLDGVVITLRTDHFAQFDYRNVLAEVKMHMTEWERI